MMVEERLRLFDASAQAARGLCRTELADFARRYKLGAEELAAALARVEAVGQWEVDARRAVELGHEPIPGLLVQAFFDAQNGQRAPAEPETLQQKASRLANQWQHNPESVKPESLDEDTRAAVREELLKRREHAA